MTAEKAEQITDLQHTLQSLRSELYAVQSAMYDGLYLAELKREAAKIKSKIARTQNKLNELLQEPY